MNTASTWKLDEQTATEEARAWLVEYLDENDGEAPAGEVIRAAERDGIARRTLQRARRAAGVETRKSGSGCWVWSKAPAEGVTEELEQWADEIDQERRRRKDAHRDVRTQIAQDIRARISRLDPYPFSEPFVEGRIEGLRDALQIVTGVRQ